MKTFVSLHFIDMLYKWIDDVTCLYICRIIK